MLRSLSQLWTALLLTLMITVPKSSRGSQFILTEREECAATDWVVIAQVSKKRSYKHPSPDICIASTVEWRVERVAHGSPPAMFTTEIAGGDIPGDHRDRVSHAPTAGLQSRYLLFLDRSAGTGMNVGFQTPLVQSAYIRHWVELSANVTLPDAQLLKDVWTEHCGVASMKPSQYSVHPAPTERYIEAIEKWMPGFSDWCDHY